MSKLTRNQFLQAGLGLSAFIAGCGDSGSGGAGGGASGGSPNTGGSPDNGGSPPSGGSPDNGGSAPNGGAPPEGGSAPGNCTQALVALISMNHPDGAHALTVDVADLDSVTDITYDISGASQHCHEITLTVADFTTLKGGGSVTKFTCNGGDHQITLSCGTPPQPGDPGCPSQQDMTGACG